MILSRWEDSKSQLLEEYRAVQVSCTQVNRLISNIILPTCASIISIPSFHWKTIWNVQTSCLLAECMACDVHSCLFLTAKKVCVFFILIRTHLDITIMIIVRIPSFVTLPQFHTLPCFVFSRKVPWTHWAMPQLSRHLLFALPDHESNSIPRVSQRACVP